VRACVCVCVCVCVGGGSAFSSSISARVSSVFLPCAARSIRYLGKSRRTTVPPTATVEAEASQRRGSNPRQRTTYRPMRRVQPGSAVRTDGCGPVSRDDQPPTHDMHPHTHARTHARTQTYTETYTRARTHACTLTCTHANTHAQAHARARSRARAHMQPCTHAARTHARADKGTVLGRVLLVRLVVGVAVLLLDR
jgi:hypothetical protein